MHIVFLFNDTATTEIYTLSLHDALPISRAGAREDLERLRRAPRDARAVPRRAGVPPARRPAGALTGRRPRSTPGARSALVAGRSEEHTSELQSRQYLVCRLLLEKKKIIR